MSRAIMKGIFKKTERLQAGDKALVILIPDNAEM